MSSDSDDHDERRDFIRMEVDCDIVYRVIGSAVFTGDWEHAHAKNLSGKGILFLARREFRKGDVLDINIQPNNPSLPPLETRVVVVRMTKDRDDDGLYEVAAIMQTSK